jgi:hypothetical protein
MVHAMQAGTALQAHPRLKAAALAMQAGTALQAHPRLKAAALAMQAGTALQARPLLKAAALAIREAFLQAGQLRRYARHVCCLFEVFCTYFRFQ